MPAVELPPVTDEHRRAAFALFHWPDVSFEQALRVDLRRRLIEACAHGIRTRRAQAGKVDMATMRAAVASPRPAAHVARDIGVSKTSVARWRRRAAARVTTGVWGQLIAR